jgi:hypothetical protein
MLTPQGPKVLDRIDKPLAEALTTTGHCLVPGRGDVSLQVRRGTAGGPRLIGGVARRGIERLTVAGRTVRPRHDGTFLVVLPPQDGTVGRTVGVEYRGGRRARLPLKNLTS